MPAFHPSQTRAQFADAGGAPCRESVPSTTRRLTAHPPFRPRRLCAPTPSTKCARVLQPSGRHTHEPTSRPPGLLESPPTPRHRLERDRGTCPRPRARWQGAAGARRCLMIRPWHTARAPDACAGVPSAMLS